MPGIFLAIQSITVNGSRVMIEPITFNTSLFAAISWMGVALAVVSPAQYAPTIASVCMGLAGGLLIQGWTRAKRKPTREVMLADLGASIFSGYISMVIGVPSCLAIVNYFIPGDDLDLKFDPANHIGWVIVLAGLAGMIGVPIFRRGLDFLTPGWENPRDT